MEGKEWVNNYRNFAKRKTQRGKQVGVWGRYYQPGELVCREKASGWRRISLSVSSSSDSTHPTTPTSRRGGQPLVKNIHKIKICWKKNRNGDSDSVLIINNKTTTNSGIWSDNQEQVEMAAIIAQMTRAKRERDKKKTYVTEKCM